MMSARRMLAANNARMGLAGDSRVGISRMEASGVGAVGIPPLEGNDFGRGHMKEICGIASRDESISSGSLSDPLVAGIGALGSSVGADAPFGGFFSGFYPHSNLQLGKSILLLQEQTCLLIVL